MASSQGRSEGAENAALRASESRYRRLFEAAQDGILLINAETAQIASSTTRAKPAAPGEATISAKTPKRARVPRRISAKVRRLLPARRARTVAAEADIDEELRYLGRVLLAAS